MRLSITLIFTLIVLSISLISAGNVFSHKQYQDSFVDWMRSNNKAYTHKEFMSRYEAFKKNMDFVHNWNTKGSETVLGLNKHADLSNEEYRLNYLGTKAHVKLNGIHKRNLGLRLNRPQFKQPLNVDWREKNAVTPVKDQGQCGSCYSFSTTGSVEGVTAIKNGTLVSLSEQNILDCSSSYGNEGCNGGLMTNAFEYIIDAGGINTEQSYPYEMKVNDECKFQKNGVAAKISSYKEIEAGDENDLQNALLLNPVSVAIDASHNSFQLYTSGVYYEPACSSEELDHGVLAVGMGSENGQDYYIVKNSWGPSWGLNGYIHMARNKDNACGIATMASYPVA
ncbi:hypothetical protein RB653_001417 [Dictyostelium firmibasis]|uniref:Cysteine proteinase n=1 Tax=Dictyostelium firmibasis TaxID=79012 RepID=A0AAN7U8D2_9MYCE